MATPWYHFGGKSDHIGDIMSAGVVTKPNDILHGNVACVLATGLPCDSGAIHSSSYRNRAEVVETRHHAVVEASGPDTARNRIWVKGREVSHINMNSLSYESIVESLTDRNDDSRMSVNLPPPANCNSSGYHWKRICSVINNKKQLLREVDTLRQSVHDGTIEQQN
jgi:hypothetical protein